MIFRNYQEIAVEQSTGFFGENVARKLNAQQDTQPIFEWCYQRKRQVILKVMFEQFLRCMIRIFSAQIIEILDLMEIEIYEKHLCW